MLGAKKTALKVTKKSHYGSKVASACSEASTWYPTYSGMRSRALNSLPLLLDHQHKSKVMGSKSAETKAVERADLPEQQKSARAKATQGLRVHLSALIG